MTTETTETMATNPPESTPVLEENAAADGAHPDEMVAASSKKTADTSPASSALAPPPVAPPPEPPITLSGVKPVGEEAVPAALEEQWRVALARGGLGADIQLGIVRRDPEGTPDRGGVIAVNARSLASARQAAGVLLAAGDGREWRYVGSGPDVEQGRFTAYLHVAPLPPA